MSEISGVVSIILCLIICSHILQMLFFLELERTTCEWFKSWFTCWKARLGTDAPDALVRGFMWT